MPDVSFSGLLIVTVVAFMTPFLLNLTPARRLPAVVLEIVAGIVIGPSGLGWVRVDLPIQILSLLGLAFLLSFGLALLVGYALGFAGQVKSPLLIAIILSATALGVVVPLLKDAGEISSDFGQIIVAGAMVAELASIILLSLFFSGEATNTGTKLVLIAGFILSAVAFAAVVLRLERSMHFS